MAMSLAVAAFATITPFNDACKVGLSDSKPPVIKAVPKSVLAKWTVQDFDDAPDCYRLFVNDGEKDYALRASEDSSIISTYEGCPASANSHPWYIVRFPDGYYYIQDIVTRRAWKLKGKAIELAPLPVENDGHEPFKFSFTFSS